MRTRSLRVTQIVFDLDGGGMETLVQSMADNWAGTQVEMSVITLSGRTGRTGESVRNRVDQFHVLELTRGLSMIAPTQLVRAIRATRPDVVHLHTGAWYKSALAARLAGVRRAIYTEHGREHDDPLLARLQDRLASRWTDTVVAVSQRLHEYMIRTVGVRADRVVTIPNGVDTARFSPGTASAALRESLDIPHGALVLGSVGRLERVKAYERLVGAYAELRRRAPEVPLVLVLFGDGAERDAIAREADRLGVRDGVRLPGWTKSPVDGYRMLDVFAMTSRSEGMSVSLMEAMACGACPLVTNVGSNAEVLGETLARHLVPDGDADALVGALAELLQSATTRRAAGARAREAALARHGLTQMLDAYERLYRGYALVTRRPNPRLVAEHPERRELHRQPPQTVDR
jgi:glycosyltransferase involved in cell wall biosynthesis